MTEKKSIKLEWLIIAALLVVIIIGGIFFLTSNNQNEITNNPQTDSTVVIVDNEQTQLMSKFERLELAYNKTISDIEVVIEDDNVNLSILKENLNQILATIKEEKEKINLGGDSLESNKFDTQQLEDMLVMSKEVLAERLIEEKEKTQKLTIDNRKLHNNLKKSVNSFEDEKTINVKLNAEVSKIKQEIKSIEAEGSNTTNEIKILRRQKKEIEKKLVVSNKKIKTQTKQIQELGDIIRKVNVDCYYVYEKGNVSEEAKIYLTSQGVAEKYIKYFVRQKPNIYVKFKLSKEFFDYGNEKVELKLYNSLNIEIYSVSKIAGSKELSVVIPNKNFVPGKYSITLRTGDEDLLVDGRYWFKIGK